MRRSTNRSADLLKKVSSQLKGEINTSAKKRDQEAENNDEIGSYLGSIARKTNASASINWENLEAPDDISSGEFDASRSGTNKFLKKNSNKNITKTKSKCDSRDSESDLSLDLEVVEKTKRSLSPAKYSREGQPKLSADAGKSGKSGNAAATRQQTVRGRAFRQFGEDDSEPSSVDYISSETRSIGRDGNKFLKKPTHKSPPLTATENHEQTIVSKQKPRIHDVNSANLSKDVAHLSVSDDVSSVTSLDDSLSEDDFKINLGNLDDLDDMLPQQSTFDPNPPPITRTNHQTGAGSPFKFHTSLPGSDSPPPETPMPETPLPDMTSDADEIRTESARGASPLRSILATPRTPNTPRASGSRVRLALCNDDDPVTPDPVTPEPVTSDLVTSDPDYSDRFDRTLSEMRSDRRRAARRDLERDLDDSASERRGRRHRGRSVSDEGTGGVASYSDDFSEVTESWTQLQETRASDLSVVDGRGLRGAETSTASRFVTKRRSVTTKTVSIQTGSMQYHWTTPADPNLPLYGLGFSDPSLITPQIVGPDAIEAMTNYNPASMALNEMLRQHLLLNQRFIETQKRLYSDMLTNMDTSFTYTTLDGTKDYIQKKRSKHKKLTFKEALKQVKKEMGIT